ncbi:hypothetical protein MYCTH_2296372 [Thermothelomyces thermophilus ATCC 42464]|uniref:Nitrogen regulatory protein areA GATA-like domain-containing protein n=1 Tax=Thermothelomyces thermophilus (strain ATCC 42464 / BCRC 31852 / DSM 1799) TaxID=573729 RepID=G2Q1G2_THET4|nr:uncharacterized protein MYCTH_2296372 [Thermothelomyces thermophilus ATCC 42464]AEO54152.1 hypothetical protein MYCTH_2296372 [Thermothelomyces thermophilus ATCC 42464]
MAVVLTSDDDSYFSPNLRRSHSQPKLGIKRSGFHTSASTSRLSDLFSQPPPESIVSSAPSSPQPTQTESVYLSDSSTPATNFSLASDTDEPSATPDEVILQQCNDEDYFSSLGNQEPPSSPREAGWNGDSAEEQVESAATSRPGSPEFQERAEDDIAVRPLPSQHVDYLSHNWREEDIWSSWKLIVSRRGDYSNAARLENASWRTWMKAKNNLTTVSAETLNWLKDYDVTWLYGPLQTGSSSWNNTSNDSTSARLSKSNSFINKKPILKKRSMSEIMLQRSLSTSSLVKQAAAAVQAQQKGGLKRIGRRPGLERANTDYITFPFSSRGMSHDGTSLFPSARSSGVVSPNSGRKHIHFNEQVSQCIAVDIKGDDDDDEVDTDNYRYDSDSDDEAITIKVTQAKKRRSVLKKLKGNNNNKSGESKTIAMLPSTTLKYREDTPEPAETSTKRSSNGVLRSPVLSPSSSQETLRPAKKSGKIFFAGDEDDEEDDEDDDVEKINIGPSASSSLQSNQGGSGLRRSVSTTSLAAESHGLRRTTSGMFMPPETSSPNSPDDGMLGRIINTVNTARDIAHVIWNVGWRR